MSKRRKKIKNWWDGLNEKYHLSVVNKDLFVEVYSWQISKGLFYLAILGTVVLIGLLTFTVISYTPLKQFVPGYETDAMHRKMIENQKKVLVMEQELKGRIAYAKKLDSILQDFKIIPDSLLNDPNNVTIEEKKPTLIAEDYINEEAIDMNLYHFFKPVEGVITQPFNPKENHFGVDIVTDKNAPVKAVLAGKVILSAWTAETGHIIAVQHIEGLISIYKHNSVLLKKDGDIVQSGEVIAIVGNSGELTTGPHLHFEIWKDQNVIDPTDILNFD
jgi:murein DD-endopeptidase MepM/ murein hydrolase activator NlpD